MRGEESHLDELWGWGEGGVCVWGGGRGWLGDGVWPGRGGAGRREVFGEVCRRDLGKYGRERWDVGGVGLA